MKFEDVVEDLKSLAGRRLSSIRPGADLTVVAVDVKGQRLELIDKSGSARVRPLKELQRVWSELCNQKAVHVESVLCGSGSSRNQPETILANLPYVEWLIVGGRKHIAFIGKRSHQMGTLKEMDAVAAHDVRESLKAPRSPCPAVIIVTEKVLSTAKFLESLSGLSCRVVSTDVCSVEFPHHEIWIVSHESVAPVLSPGSYVACRARRSPPRSQLIGIAGRSFCVVCVDNYQVVVHVG